MINLETLVNAHLAFQNLLQDHARLTNLLNEDKKEMLDEIIEAWAYLSIEIKKELQNTYAEVSDE